MKLLDTAVAIDHLRGFEPAVELLARLSEEDELLAASELVRFELRGLACARMRSRRWSSSSSALTWWPVDRDVTRAAGSLARRFRGAHRGIDDVDYLIAATAIVLDAELLTTNVRHFPMLDGLQSPY